MRAITRSASLLLFSWALAAGSSAPAKDVFLTIGGGYSPAGNQVSLEKNILFFQRFLAEQRPDGAPHDIYFADGHAPGRDVQVADAEGVPTSNWLMAELFGNQEHIHLEYRNHQIPGVRGSTSEENLQSWFEETGSTLQSGDRLIVYVTAHGGRSRDKDHPQNTRLYLWNDQSLPVSDLAEMIGRLPEGVQVVTIMVQCYAGGFASLIFNGADESKGLVDRDCCGFYATVHDRPAAGCTADVHEDNYHEYSTYFWAALGGLTRTGEHLERPDFNGDGQVSFSEAHAYVMLASSTIDIPVKTSGAFLRTHSKLGSRRRPELLSADSRYDHLLRLATPAEAVVLESLSAELGLTLPRRADAADELADELEKKRKELAKEVSRKQRGRRRLKRRIAADLQDRWPELENVLSATATALLTTRAAEFEEAVLSHERYSDFARLAEEIAALEEQRMDLERQWVKCRRLKRVLENVALARNLPLVASPEVVRRYERLIAAEESTIHAARSVAPPSPIP